MAGVKWIKITTDILDNPKIKYLRSLSQGDTLVILWLWLIITAGKCNACGRIYITADVPYSPNLIASEIGTKTSVIIKGLDVMERLNMIASTGGEIMILNWEEYQNAAGLEAIRAKDRDRKRAKRKQLKNGISADMSADIPRTNPESPCADIDIDIDVDTDNQNNYPLWDSKKAQVNSNITVSKKSYGEYGNVMLTDDEYGKLCAEYPNTDAAITYLDAYIGEKGCKSKSHFLTLKRWVFAALEEQRQRIAKNTQHNSADLARQSANDYLEAVLRGEL